MLPAGPAAREGSASDRNSEPAPGGRDAAIVVSVISIVCGLIVNGLTVPGRHDTHVLQALEAIPGTLIAIALCYWQGVRKGNEAIEF